MPYSNLHVVLQFVKAGGGETAPVAVRGLVHARPLAWQAGYSAMHGAGAAVGEVQHHVVVVHCGVIQGVAGLNADYGFNVAVHASRRRQVIYGVRLPVPHDHPCHHVACNKLLLQPYGKRVSLRHRQLIVSERLVVNLEVGPRLVDVARQDLAVMSAAVARVVPHLLLRNPSAL